jgi:hypothetical protein
MQFLCHRGTGNCYAALNLTNVLLPNVVKTRILYRKLNEGKSKLFVGMTLVEWHEDFLSSVVVTNFMEKLTVAQLLKNFPTFYGTQRFITVFTRALHWFLS